MHPRHRALGGILGCPRGHQTTLPPSVCPSSEKVQESGSGWPEGMVPTGASLVFLWAQTGRSGTGHGNSEGAEEVLWGSSQLALSNCELWKSGQPPGLSHLKCRFASDRAASQSPGPERVRNLSVNTQQVDRVRGCTDPRPTLLRTPARGPSWVPACPCHLSLSPQGLRLQPPGACGGGPGVRRRHGRGLEEGPAQLLRPLHALRAGGGLPG